jgi:ParB-like chromosome segregation protein Spo0J
MPEAKIDKVELSRLLRSGKAQREIAQVFGVTESAISKAKKELNLNVVKNVALENAHRVVDKHLNAVDQLQKINEHANWLLDLLMDWQKGDGKALQILESQVSTKKVRVGNKEESVRTFKFKDPRELALKAMAEIRGQLKLQLEIFQCLYDMQAVQEFQDEVLTSIGEASPDVRDKIIRSLNEKRAIRSAVKFN